VTVGVNPRSLMAAVLAASALGILASPDPVEAATTIGPDLLSAAPTNTFSCDVVGGCTYSQGAPTYTSPISGTVVGWIVRGASGPLALRIINGNTGVATSGVRSPPTYGVECFPTDLPISAGNRIGVDLPAGFVSNIGVRQPYGSSVDGWTPWLGNGATLLPNHTYPNYALLVDAIIQPVSGPPAGCPPTGQPTGQRAAALKRCQKKFLHNKKRLRHKRAKLRQNRAKLRQNKKKRRKCRRKARRLPL
jgi:hypothetical protein